MNNTCISWGCGLYVTSDQGTINLEDNIFTGNTGSGYFSEGGGVYARSSKEIVFNKNLFENYSANYAGAVAAYGNFACNITFNSNDFVRNTAQLDSGGFYVNSSGVVKFVNNIFSNNKSNSNGGAGSVYKWSDAVTFTNNTIYNNNAKNGGGLYIILMYDSATLNFYNNILWNNIAVSGGNDGDDLYVNSDDNKNNIGSIVNLYNNSFSGKADFTTGQSEGLYITNTSNYRNGSNIQGDPLFVSSDDLHLKVNSPCVNKGNNLAPELPLTDKDGNLRISNGIVDIGAYEFISSQIALRLLQPNGGQKWKAGFKYVIKWEAPLDSYKFNLRYSTDNKTTWTNIATVLASNRCTSDGTKYICTYPWTIPAQDGRKPQSFVRVRAFDSSNQVIGTDDSDKPFVIEVLRLTSPNGGETLTVGQTYQIKWETYALTKTVAKIILQYSTNGGQSWTSIKTLTGNP